MDKKIQVLDVKIDKFTAKEAMQYAVEYMKTESVHVIEMITLDTLKGLHENQEWREQIDTFDIAIAGDKAILEAAGVKEENLLKEAETRLFVKMFAKFLHKNAAKVFLFAENEQMLSQLREYIEEAYGRMEIVETATLEEHGVSDDLILNRMNGADADCIIAALTSPAQEAFIIKNRMAIGAKIWLGLGTQFQRKNGVPLIKKIKTFFIRQFLKKETEKNRIS